MFAENQIRVLGVVGSPRRGGNTEILVDEVLHGAEEGGALIEKVVLSEVNKLLVVDASEVARKAQAGQFVIVRIDEEGERIPLTIADYDR